MRKFLFRSGLALLLPALAAVSSPIAKAELIVAGTTNLDGTAIMDLKLFGHTALNPGDEVTLFGVSGDGTITLNRDAQVGSTINIGSLAGGMYYGFNPALGNYVFGNIAPLTGANFSGSITNVVQNPADPGYATGQASSFLSGDFSFGGASFGFMFLNPPVPGPSLYTDPAVPFSFGATFDGLPPSQGTVLVNTGPDVLNVTFNGVVVAQSFNRRILLHSVPEPTSLAMLAFGVVGGLVHGLRRRRSRATTPRA